MASSFRIVCVTTQHPHRHIVDVGTGPDPARAETNRTLTEVRAAIADGDRFYTLSPSTGNKGYVALDECGVRGCAVGTIRSAADADEDNNLDEMRTCRW